MHRQDAKIHANPAIPCLAPVVGPMKHLLLRVKPLLVLLLLATPFRTQEGVAWSEKPHLAITKAAIKLLPAWQRNILGGECAKLCGRYCLIPDQVYTDKENAKFASMESRPGEVYLLNLHLPAQQPQNLETLRYFMAHAVGALKASKTADAARFMGTVGHMLEDYGSPAHTVPGDNMFTMLQQFLPPPEHMKGKLLHGPIESGEFEVVVNGYQPRLLGTTVDESAWRLLHRVHEAIINARSTTIPIIRGLYADDAKAVLAGQMKAATMDAKVVADAFYTILCLGAGKFDAGERESLRTVGIGAFFPLEAVNLYFPQTEFSGSPNWGHARSGVLLEGGAKETPLKLRLEQDGARVEKVFANGVSVCMGKSLTYPVPVGVYRRFTVLAGLHPQLGAKGCVAFTIKGDGRQLASATVNGNEPAHLFDCDLAGVAQFQLAVASRGGDPKSNYAIWAEPTLVKKQP
jgi:hypothetical protein